VIGYVILIFFLEYYFRIPVINAEDFQSSCDIVEDLENSIGGLFLGEYQKNTRELLHTRIQAFW
jgi:hypothetical protein